MRITGTLQSIGTHHLVDDPRKIDTHDEVVNTVHGILITADDDTLRAASNLLCTTVDIYPHPVKELIKGECTPENYAHALARLAHAEASSPTADHLAREVRSSQALLAKQAEQERLMTAYRVECNKMTRLYREAAAERDEARRSLEDAQTLLAQCTPPRMFIREDGDGWRLTTDHASTWHQTEAAAHAAAWTVWRTEQAEARAVSEEEDERGRDENGNALA